MLAIIDFSNLSFKEVMSLSEDVSNFLNQGSRLERNSKQDIVRPDVEKVRQEILKDRTKNNKHHNELPEDYPELKKDTSFKYLGLVTKKKSKMLGLKPKPIMFKLRSRTSVSVTI